MLVFPPSPTRPPLPLVTERFRSNGFDGESHRFSWRNILQLLGLTDDSGRLSCRRGMTVTMAYYLLTCLDPFTSYTTLTPHKNIWAEDLRPTGLPCLIWKGPSPTIDAC